MADQKISELPQGTPQDTDEITWQRGATANYRGAFSVLVTYLQTFFAALSHRHDHGADLDGLGDDDHPQYHTDARGDARYAPKDMDVLITDGDLLTRQAGSYAKVGIGTNGQVLTVTSGAPAWENPSGGASSPLTTKGDLWGFSTVDARIPVGADGLVLEADSTQALGVKWGVKSSGGGGDVTGPASAVADNFALFNGTTGKVIKDGGVNAASFDAAGSASGVQGNLDTHIADNTNPHSVTAAQLGALQNVVEDTTPQLGGDLDTNGSNVVLARDDSSVRGMLGATEAIDGAALLYTRDPLIFDQDDGGVVVQPGRVSAYGTSVDLPGLKHGVSGGRQVYVAEDGTLFGVDPPPAGWFTDDTDTGNYSMGTGDSTGPWVDISGIVLTLQDDVVQDQVLTVSANFWVVLGKSGDVSDPMDKASSIEFGFGIDGASPAAPSHSASLSPYFNGPVTFSFTFAAGAAYTSGQEVSIWARRGNGDDSSCNPWIQYSSPGGVVPHEASLSTPGSGSGVGGSGIAKGTPFITGDLLAVQDTANDGTAQSVGFDAADVARLSVENFFTGPALRLDTDQHDDLIITANNKKASGIATLAAINNPRDGQARIISDGLFSDWTLRGANAQTGPGAVGMTTLMRQTQTEWSLSHIGADDGLSQLDNVLRIIGGTSTAAGERGAVQFGEPTGGYPSVGRGHVNAEGLYVNGVAVSTATNGVVEDTNTYAIAGTLVDGDTLEFYLPVGAFITGVTARVKTGSVTANVKYNGVTVPPLGAINVTDTAQNFAGAATEVTSNIHPVLVTLSSAAGDDLSLTVFTQKPVTLL